MASTLKVDNLQTQDGDSYNVVSWDTTAKTAAFTAVSGKGYFVNTTSGAITVTLPAGSAGSIVSLKDYANTWDTNNVTVTPNGTDKINGVNNDAILSTEDQSVTLVYVDSTKGWRVVQDSTSDVTGASFIVASGGTETTCGDYKIHTFTGPGTFTVCSVGNPAGSDTVDYLVVAGGGGSGRNGGGGGGGGFRESSGAASGCYTASPLGACVSALPVTAQGYPITVGGGGPGGSPGSDYGVRGSNSVFSTITSTGGGGGSSYLSASPSRDGGSGSGGGARPASRTAGTGNTPPVSPPQGNNGGAGGSDVGPGFAAGGGGGAIAAGTTGSSTCAPIAGGDGGNGATTSISASPTSYSGGGGGGTWDNNPGGTGGTGGGGDGATGFNAGTAGTTNTGGGGGGPSSANTNCASPSFGVSGGSGIVIIRYKYQ